MDVCHFDASDEVCLWKKKKVHKQLNKLKGNGGGLRYVTSSKIEHAEQKAQSPFICIYYIPLYCLTVSIAFFPCFLSCTFNFQFQFQFQLQAQLKKLHNNM